MRLSAPTETSTPRTASRLRRRSSSSKWSSEEWLSRSLSLRKRFKLRTTPLRLRHIRNRSTLRKTQSLRETLRRSRSRLIHVITWSRPKKLILLVSSTWSQKPSKRSRSSVKTTRWWSTSAISWAPSWSSVTKSSKSCTRRSRSSSRRSTRERSTTKTVSRRSSASRTRSQSSSGCSLSHRTRQRASQTLGERSFYCRKSCWSSSRKRSSSLTSWTSHWMCTGGGSWSARTPRRTSWYRRYSHSKRDW